MTRSKLKYILILLGLSYLFFMLGNGIVNLTNPDEVFYFQTAKEMADRHTWMTPYLFGAPQFEKPILLFWLLRIGAIIFPNPNFAARFFPALFAGLGVIAVYLLGLVGLKDERKAFISGLVLMSCGLYIGLARTVFTDMIFSVFILFSLLSFYWGYAYPKRKTPGIFLFFIFSGLAVLAKGPLGFFIPFLIVVIFLWIRKEIKFLFCRESLWGFFIFAAVSFPWYVFIIRKYGWAFIQEFFYNDHFRRLIEAEHSSNDTWYFYPFSIIGCIFPWSLYVLASLFYFFKYLRKNGNPIYLFLGIWIGIVFLTFQPAHSKLISYIVPLFPALAIITADFIYDAVTAGKANKAFFSASIVTGFILLVMAVGIGVSSRIPRLAAYFYSMTPIYVSFFTLVFLCALFYFFIFRRRYLNAIFALTALMCSLSISLIFILKEVEPYVCSKEISEYLLNNYDVKGPIISSKPFVRGVRYYTQREIIAVDVPGKNFFSPHPILFLYNDAQIKDYLRRQTVAYCILKKANIEDFERIASDKEFGFTILKIIGNEYIVKIEHLKKG